MANNISNIKLYLSFYNDDKVQTYLETIKKKGFNKLYTNEKITILEDTCNALCNNLEKLFKLKPESLLRPKIDFKTDRGDFGKYNAETNTISLNDDNIKPYKLLHEFRHYIQFQFKEKSYYEGVVTPLPDPFYQFQKHEKNAYNFQRLYHTRRIPEILTDSWYKITSKLDLSLLGYFNKESFTTCREYYKTYNKMCDYEKSNNLSVEYPNCKAEEYSILYKGEKFNVKHFNDGNHFYNINRNDVEINFGIIDKECKIYAISKKENNEYSLIEFINQNGSFTSKENEYRKICKDSIDIVANFCKNYGVKCKDIDFEEYTKKFGVSINKKDLAYTSLNKFINDTLVISNKNKGNRSSYMRVIDYDYDIENDEDDNDTDLEMTNTNQKYIYTFKGLGAEAYDSFISIWTLTALAKAESKEIEFLFASEKFNFKDKKHIKETTDLPQKAKDLFKIIGLDITYENSDEILQQIEREETQFDLAKQRGKLRNQELFRNNIRAKGIPTKCCLCGCEIENILEAAHIWGVAEIKRATNRTINETLSLTEMQDLIDSDSPYAEDDFYKRYVMANSGDNGIWLCKNHHGLFDSHFYCFDATNGKIIIAIDKFSDEDTKLFFNFITKYEGLTSDILTDKTKIFLSHNQV